MINELNYDGIAFSVTQKQYNKIETQNSISINIFGYENKQPYPIYISKETFEDKMNLLLITKDENKHYVLIKDFNSFMSKHKERKHFCMYCLQCFSSEIILSNHIKNCLTINGKQAINMPKEGENMLKFNNFYKQFPVPFVIYADFEAITKKVQEQNEETHRDEKEGSYTKAYQTHEDCGCGYKVVCCCDDKYSKPVKRYRGENAVYKFMENMLSEVEYYKDVVKKHFNKPLVMTEDDEMRFKLMDKCAVTFAVKSTLTKMCALESIVTLPEKVRGSAYQDCNLKLRIKPEDNKIPVIFRNLRGYDSHLIMQQIGEIDKKHAYTNKKGEKQDLNINTIPNNMEKYMAFMLGNHLTLIDSFQFMSSSLDKLVSNLPKEAFKYTSQVFKGKKLDLMSKKAFIHTTLWIVSKSIL